MLSALANVKLRSATDSSPVKEIPTYKLIFKELSRVVARRDRVDARGCPSDLAPDSEDSTLDCRCILPAPNGRERDVSDAICKLFTDPSAFSRLSTIDMSYSRLDESSLRRHPILALFSAWAAGADEVDDRSSPLPRIHSLRVANNTIDGGGGGEDSALHLWLSLVHRNLCLLDLFGNVISCLPRSLWLCRHLVSLDVGRNNLSEVPASIGELVCLRRLNLSFNNLRTLPESIGNLCNLRVLLMRGNNFPPRAHEGFQRVCSFWTLDELRVLDIGGNGLKELSSSVGRLSKLTRLNLYGNRLTLSALPVEELMCLPLEYVCLEHNSWSAEEEQALRVKLTMPPARSDAAATAIDDAEAPASMCEDARVAAGRVIGMEPLVPRPPCSDGYVAFFGHLQRDIDAIERARRGSTAGVARVPLSAMGDGHHRDALVDRIRGTLYGAAIGDAVGLATEFLSSKQAEFYYGGDATYAYEHVYRDGHRSVFLPGDWTDDTDQMLVILDSVLSNDGEVDPKDFAKRLRDWLLRGYPELGDKGGSGCGTTVHSVLTHRSFLSDPHRASKEVFLQSGGYAAANGGLMRTAPLGIFQFHDLEAVLRNSKAICRVTHWSDKCVASCAAITSAIATMLSNPTSVDVDHVMEVAFAAACSEVSDVEELSKYMYASCLDDLALDEGRTIGYTYKCLGSAMVAFRTSTQFESEIIDIVRQGGDADTNACVAGALLGCRFGFSALPKRWLEGLVHREWLERKVQALLGLMGLA